MLCLSGFQLYSRWMPLICIRMPRHCGSGVPFCKLTQVITSHKISKRKSILHGKFLFLFFVNRSTHHSVDLVRNHVFSALYAYLTTGAKGN